MPVHSSATRHGAAQPPSGLSGAGLSRDSGYRRVRGSVSSLVFGFRVYGLGFGFRALGFLGLGLGFRVTP